MKNKKNRVGEYVFEGGDVIKIIKNKSLLIKNRGV